MKLTRRAFLGTSAVAAGGALIVGFTTRGHFFFGKTKNSYYKRGTHPLAPCYMSRD